MRVVVGVAVMVALQVGRSVTSSVTLHRPPSKWWLGPIASRGSPPDTYRPARRFCGRG